MVTSPQEIVIQNNTVVNRLSNDVGSGLGEGQLDPNSMTIGSLVVDCKASQGDHSPIWAFNSLDSAGIGGPVNTGDSEGENRQIIADYTARYEDQQYTFAVLYKQISTPTRLRLNSVDPQLEGSYSCLSQQSDLFTTFILSTGNTIND